MWAGFNLLKLFTKIKFELQPWKWRDRQCWLLTPLKSKDQMHSRESPDYFLMDFWLQEYPWQFTTCFDWWSLIMNFKYLSQLHFNNSSGINVGALLNCTPFSFRKLKLSWIIDSKFLWFHACSHFKHRIYNIWSLLHLRSQHHCDILLKNISGNFFAISIL